jgi:hypothetical protein
MAVTARFVGRTGTRHSRSSRAFDLQSPLMDFEAVVQNIDSEIRRLEKARALLTGHTVPDDERRGTGKDRGSSE